MILEELTLILNLNQWKLWSLKSRIIWLLSKFGIKPKICRFKQNYPQQSLTSHKIQMDGDWKGLFNLRWDPARETFVAFVWPPETGSTPTRDADWMLGNLDPTCCRNTKAILLHPEWMSGYLVSQLFRATNLVNSSLMRHHHLASWQIAHPWSCL